jgi:hypothetical protein
VTDRIWDLPLFFVAAGLGAFGVLNKETAPVLLLLAGVTTAVLLVHWARRWIGDRLVGLGLWMGGIARARATIVPEAIGITTPETTAAERERREAVKVVLDKVPHSLNPQGLRRG